MAINSRVATDPERFPPIVDADEPYSGKWMRGSFATIVAKPPGMMMAPVFFSTKTNLKCASAPLGPMFQRITSALSCVPFDTIPGNLTDHRKVVEHVSVILPLFMSPISGVRGGPVTDTTDEGDFSPILQPLPQRYLVKSWMPTGKISIPKQAFSSFLEGSHCVSTTF